MQLKIFYYNVINEYHGEYRLNGDIDMKKSKEIKININNITFSVVRKIDDNPLSTTLFDKLTNVFLKQKENEYYGGKSIISNE